ncbi:MAG: VPS9 domain-containing protein [archaeon]|nr:VPS9 domain-containing protein [archaeon]
MGNRQAHYNFREDAISPLKKDKIISSYFNELTKAKRTAYLRYLDRQKVNIYINELNNLIEYSSGNPNNQNYEPNPEMSWYDNSYNYLYYLNEDWSAKLLRWMDRECFLFENKFHSLSFFQQFQMESEPKVLLDKETFIEEEFEKKIFEQKRDFNISNITNKLGGSITYGGICPTELCEDVDTDFLYHRGRTKEVIHLLKDYLSEREHPINLLINKFSEYFSEYLYKKKTAIRNNTQFDDSRKSLSMSSSSNRVSNAEFNTAGLNDMLIDIESQIKDFIKNLELSVKLFYSSTMDIGENFSCDKGDVMNLLFWFLFQNEDFYKNLFKLYKSLFKSEIKSLKRKLEKVDDILPEDIGISPKFCLNAYTKQTYNLANVPTGLQNMFNIGSRKGTSTENPPVNKSMNVNIENEDFISDNKQKIVLQNDEENDSSRVVFLSNCFQENFSLKRESTNLDIGIQDIPFDLTGSPYKLAITLLRRMEFLNSPIEKLILITDLRKKIVESINDFWSNYPEVVDAQEKGFLSIESDELMKIMTYVVIRAKKSDILIQTKIIKEYTANETKKTMFGYYSSYIDAAISRILDCNDLKNMKYFLEEQQS